jgi:DNA ligase-1
MVGPFPLCPQLRFDGTSLAIRFERQKLNSRTLLQPVGYHGAPTPAKMDTTLLQFAHVNDALAQTASKLAKQKLLAEFLRPLSEADLRLAVRFAGGRPFPSTDERTLNVGFAIFSEVAIRFLCIEPARFYELVRAHGEVGEALSAVWPDLPPPSPLHSITLKDLGFAFDDLAATGLQQSKRELLTALLNHCTLPREAAYLAKIIFGDLRTGAQYGVLQAAIAVAFDKTLAQIQRCQLLVGDLDEVAVLAKHDALASARFHLFHPIQFMLATPQQDADVAAKTLAGRAFWAEDKLDGIRAQIHKSGKRIAIYTRTMDRVDESFPDVVDAIAPLPGDFLLDGEIVPWRDDQVLPFVHLQKRLGRKKLTHAILRDNPLAYFAFDVLYLDGQLLMDEPLRKRRALLDAFEPLHKTSIIETTDAPQISAAFDLARQRRNEGIVLKDPDSIYSPGRRGQVWLKIKTHLPTLDCVVTAAEFGHGKRRNVLSDYTFAVWDRNPADPAATLMNVGKAYSGVTDAEIAQLTDIFKKIAISGNGRVFRVAPKVVLEIACDQIQRSTRHASGYALRFPRIKRIRWDKLPADADQLVNVRELYESSPNFARPLAKPPVPAPEPTLFDGIC